MKALNGSGAVFSPACYGHCLIESSLFWQRLVPLASDTLTHTHTHTHTHTRTHTHAHQPLSPLPIVPTNDHSEERGGVGSVAEGGGGGEGYIRISLADLLFSWVADHSQTPSHTALDTCISFDCGCSNPPSAPPPPPLPPPPSATTPLQVVA
jgi:hypothetical protein